MIISRLIPPDTNRYQKARTWSAKLDGIFQVRWELFFGLWSMLLSGFSIAAMQNDRYLYWQSELGFQSTLMFCGFTLLLAGLFGFSNLQQNNIEKPAIPWLKKFFWIISIAGLICLVFSNPLILIPVTLIVIVLGPLSQYRPLELNRPSIRQGTIFIGLAFLLFLTGWFYKDGQLLSGLRLGFPYVLGFMAVVMVYWIAIELNAEGSPVKLTSNRQRILMLVIAIILDLSATILGYLNDDPIISTAACVFLPFLLVALAFPPHFRHILRCRIYPIFILSMLVVVRYPWFLLPLGLNFWVLRGYTYLRFGFPQPTFRVDYD